MEDKMNLNEMTNEQLFDEFDKTASNLISLHNIKETKEFAPVFLEIKRRLYHSSRQYSNIVI